MKDYWKLFITGVVQVFFVAVNTWLIAHEKWVWIGPTGFTISFIWTYNVKKVVFGGMVDRVAYALGASVGTLLGVLASTVLFK